MWLSRYSLRSKMDVLLPVNVWRNEVKDGKSERSDRNTCRCTFRRASLNPPSKQNVPEVDPEPDTFWNKRENINLSIVLGSYKIETCQRCLNYWVNSVNILFNQEKCSDMIEWQIQWYQRIRDQGDLSNKMRQKHSLLHPNRRSSLKQVHLAVYHLSLCLS